MQKDRFFTSIVSTRRINIVAVTYAIKLNTLKIVFANDKSTMAIIAWKNNTIQKCKLFNFALNTAIEKLPYKINANKM